MESDIPAINIAAESAITDAITKARAAFDARNLLTIHPWTRNTVDTISSSLAWEFDLDQEKLASFITDDLFSEIHTVSNPNHRSPCEVLYAWIHKSAYRHSLNETRHLQVVRRHEEATAHEHTIGKINSVPILGSASLSPEDQLLEKEAEEMREAQKMDVRARVRQIITSYPPDYITIAYLWGKLMMSPGLIAEETQIPVKTVYGRLETMQKAIIKEIGIAEIELEETAENRRMVKEGLRQLFANSLQGLFIIALSVH